MRTCSHEECHGKPCRFWCPVHQRNHPVANMVDHCLERATEPQETCL